jgi:gas vesicle protein
MSKIGGFLKTLTFGGLLGLVAGLLFAPTKGEETREKLQSALAKGKEKFQEIKGEFTPKEE